MPSGASDWTTIGEIFDLLRDFRIPRKTVVVVGFVIGLLMSMGVKQEEVGMKSAMKEQLMKGLKIGFLSSDEDFHALMSSVEEVVTVGVALGHPH